MDTVSLYNKEFVLRTSYAEIQARIGEMAEEMHKTLAGKDPVFLIVLNGAFMFAADLLKKIRFNCHVAFIRVASYNGITSTGIVKNIIGLEATLKNKTVVIVEDIIDSGETIQYLVNELKSQQPQEVLIATLLLKPMALKHHMIPDFTGFEVPNDFLVGYGLDYDGLGRNLNDIYVLKQD
jgi:hypoxanthine phosphoribosyltransferase